MNQLTQLKIRFSNAANAVGLTTKALRNWLQRNEIDLISDHTGSEWTEFTYGDIAILAIMRELVRWGVGVNDANEIAFVELKLKAGLLFEYRNTPKEALVALFKPWAMLVYVPESETEVGHAMIQFSEIDDIRNELPALLVLNVGVIIEQAFERLQ